MNYKTIDFISIRKVVDDYFALRREELSNGIYFSKLGEKIVVKDMWMVDMLEMRDKTLWNGFRFFCFWEFLYEIENRIGNIINEIYGFIPNTVVHITISKLMEKWYIVSSENFKKFLQRIFDEVMDRLNENFDFGKKKDEIQKKLNAFFEFDQQIQQINDKESNEDH